MKAGKNSVIYMGLISGPNKADDTCGPTTVTGTMHRGFTVYSLLYNVIFNRTYLFDYMYACTVFYLFYFTMTISTFFDCILYGSMENEYICNNVI
jgi:hypothetical protein